MSWTFVSQENSGKEWSGCAVPGSFTCLIACGLQKDVHKVVLQIESMKKTVNANTFGNILRPIDGSRFSFVVMWAWFTYLLYLFYICYIFFSNSSPKNETSVISHLQKPVWLSSYVEIKNRFRHILAVLHNLLKVKSSKFIKHISRII